MDQFNIRVDDDTKQMVTDMIDQWRQGTESNGDVFARIVNTAKTVGQDKPVELVKALSGSRQTVNVLLRQINSVVEVEQTQIEDLKKQLAAKDQEIETQATEYKKRFLELGDSNREKVAGLQTKIDELKDWLRVATEDKAKLEQERKGDADALQSYRENLTDKKTLIDKLNNDLNEKNKKIVELQQKLDAAQETLNDALQKADTKHQNSLKQIEEKHQFELEQQRTFSATEIEKVKAECAAERAQALEKKAETLHQEFAEERKELQEKLDKKQELLDNLKDQLSATRENNVVLKQQLQSQQKG